MASVKETGVKETGVKETRVPTVKSVDEIIRDHGLGHESLWHRFRRWPRLSLWSLALLMPILLYGYDNVIVGNITSVAAFQRHYGERLDDRYIISSKWLAVWSIASPVGQTVGSVFGGPLMDWLGRRWTLIWSSLFCAAGVAVCFVSDLPADADGRRGAFTAGKFLEGGSIGIMFTTTITYMSEVLPPGLRGPILAFFPIFTLLGQALGAVAVFASTDHPGHLPFRIPFASQWPFNAAVIVVAWFLPESPVWLLRNGRDDDAMRCQQRLADNAETIVAEVKETLQNEKEYRSVRGYIECFKGVDRRRTLIIIFANCLPQIWGLKLMSLVSYFLQIVGLGESLSLIILIVGIVVGIFANIGSLWTLKAFGRRPLSIITLAVASVFWASVGIAGCFEGPAAVWYVVAGLILVVITCSVGVWPASYAIAAETSSLRLRALSQGIGGFASGLSTVAFGIILPYIFNPDAGNLRGKTGFVYTGFCIMGAVITWFYVPEMKDRKPADIDAMFELKLPTRKFKTWTAPDVNVKG